MGNKAEIAWKRANADGEKVQVFARYFGRQWLFFIREKRYDVWRPVPDPALEDWLELLDAVRRRITRRLMMPDDEERLIRIIRERHPDLAIP